MTKIVHNLEPSSMGHDTVIHSLEIWLFTTQFNANPCTVEHIAYYQT